MSQIIEDNIKKMVQDHNPMEKGLRSDGERNWRKSAFPNINGKDNYWGTEWKVQEYQMLN